MNQRTLTQEKLSILTDALYFLKMTQLKRACDLFQLPTEGKKIELIKRILTFVQTGKIIHAPTIPEESHARNYPVQAISSSALMLYGSYKNDAETRAFFKKIIGPHFHFTAFGIDWLNELWLNGNPPTYQEFADYWSEETARRKDKRVKPKDEWRYINFLQHMQKEQPSLSKTELMKKWKKLQADNARTAFEILQSIKN
ncbi:MAG: hypothetical protein BWY54_00208 [Candidatus Dependentiae bacterium ADurb.Bin331]|nr:MAG: hypothetical protein BWY54_00208 [Candidatus Dependentiae bacterium ADurb.Bin331]